MTGTPGRARSFAATIAGEDGVAATVDEAQRLLVR